MWYEATMECNGREEAIAKQNECHISLTTLLAEPFLLLNGDSVHVRIYLIDEDGWTSLTPILVEPGQTAIIN